MMSFKNLFKDEKERFRRFFNEQYVKMKQMAAVGSLILLAINLSLTIYPYIEHRRVHPYAAVPLLFLGIMLLIWFGSHIYVKKMEMYRTERRAEVLFNPYAIYAMNPFQEMTFKHMYLPMMESICIALPEGKDKEKMKKNVAMVKRWCDKGFIPKEDFPKHLKRYYLTNKQKRL